MRKVAHRYGLKERERGLGQIKINRRASGGQRGEAAVAAEEEELAEEGRGRGARQREV